MINQEDKKQETQIKSAGEWNGQKTESPETIDVAGGSLSASALQYFEAVPMAVSVFSCQNNRLKAEYFNQTFLQVFHYSSREEAARHIEQDLRQDICQEDAARVFDQSSAFIRQGAPYNVYYRNRRPDQTEWHTIHAVGSRIDYEGKRIFTVFYMDETTALSENLHSAAFQNPDQARDLKQRMWGRIDRDNGFHRNQYDDLTGLPNLSHFFEVAPEQVEEMQKTGKKAALLWIELSGLREYNTMNGFKRGNELLRGFGSLIRKIFGVETSARSSGEWFTTLTDEKRMDDEIQRLFQETGQLNEGNSLPVKVGIYCFADDREESPQKTSNQEIKAAESKPESGKEFEINDISDACDRARMAAGTLADSIHSEAAHFDLSMLKDNNIRKYVLQNFRNAMKEGWIQVYYQPVVRTLTGKLCGAEALARWIDPVYGMISPGQFIPVLEEHGLTTDFDIYIAEQVCKDYKQRSYRGMISVPVSINLSRKDFRQPDLIQKLEGLAQKYSVPRENINIEITESAFVRHQERIRSYINDFHNLGFKVWMDDFGTAYSSLGSLRELNFDELKIDMSFLAQSNYRARSIVTSIVQMAKKIGIQTLAEGVETKEQYDFLRRIGCEKIQGYYIGKPMDKKSFVERIRELHIEEEKTSWKNYYDAIGRVNFQTNQPLCIIEDDGDNLRCLYINQEYTDVLRRDGVNGIEEWLKEINAKSSPAYIFHRKYCDEQLRKREGLQIATYPSGDHYMELSGVTIARHGNYYAYALELRYISLDMRTQNQEMADYIQLLYYLCHDIAVIDLEESTITGLKSADSDQPIGTGWSPVGLNQALQDYCERFVYPPDHEKYWDFVNPMTLRERMLKAKGQNLTAFLRSGKSDGEYEWLLHILMSVPKTDSMRYLDVTLPIDLFPELIGTIAQEESITSEGEADRISGPVMTDALLWRNQVLFGKEMYFWKDNERRFLGASQSFLDFYGFDSVDDIRGKTDEDMGWHVEKDPFRNDELAVLQHGKSFYNVLGNCISRGRQEKILASKMPVYKDGRIIGLMGKFAPLEEFLGLADRSGQMVMVDPVTGLQNSLGIVDSCRNYLEALWTEGEVFSLIYLWVPEHESFKDRYGSEAGDKLLRQIADILRELSGRVSTTARLTGSHFAMLIQTGNKEGLENLKQQLQEAIGHLRNVEDLPCALTAEVRITIMDESNANQIRYIDALHHLIRYMVGEKE